MVSFIRSYVKIAEIIVFIIIITAGSCSFFNLKNWNHLENFDGDYAKKILWQVILFY